MTSKVGSQGRLSFLFNVVLLWLSLIISLQWNIIYFLTSTKGIIIAFISLAYLSDPHHSVRLSDGIFKILCDQRWPILKSSHSTVYSICSLHFSYDIHPWKSTILHAFHLSTAFYFIYALILQTHAGMSKGCCYRISPFSEEAFKLFTAVY